MKKNFFKLRLKPTGADPQFYFLDTDRKDIDENLSWTPYENAIWDEECRFYSFNDISSMERKLELLACEIKTRVRITKQEIFIIGELLCMAKRFCQEEKISFKAWVDENFDFSYETGVNFMHVHRYCLGIRQVALQVPTTVLYNICRPTFPNELRDYLLTDGHIEALTKGDYKALVKEYKEGGMEAIEPQIEEVNRSRQVFKQCQVTFDLIENALRVLEDLNQKVSYADNFYNGKFVEYERLVEHMEPEAGEVNLRLHNELEACIDRLRTARDEMLSKINQFYYGIRKGL
jgi:hypothetical protein